MRHRAGNELLTNRLQELGFAFVVDKEHRLPQLNTVWAPQVVE